LTNILLTNFLSSTNLGNFDHYGQILNVNKLYFFL